GLAGAGYADAESLVSPETGFAAGAGAAAGGIAGPVILGAGRIAKKGVGALVNKAKQTFPNASGVPQKAVEQMAENSGLDDDMARYIFKGGKASTDPLYKEAVKQGIPEATINSIKALSRAEKDKVLRMLRVIKIGKGNTAFAKDNRAGDTVGARFEEVINYAGNINKKARMNLSNYVKKNLQGKPVDIDDALNDFISDIDDLGINVTASEKTGRAVTDTYGAAINRQDKTPLKNVIEHVSSVMDKGRPDAATAHRLKKVIDNNLVYDKATPMSTDSVNALRALRRKVDDALDTTYPEYNKFNTEIKDTIKQLKVVQKAAGSSFDINSPNAAKRLGTDVRALMANTKNRVPMMDAINGIEGVAKKYKMKPGASIKKLAYIVDDLEDIFGASSQTGFRPEITKGIKDAIKGGTSAIDMTENVVVKGIESGIEVLSDVDESQAFNILEQMLKR
ncbi:unnamed protein product, partial [marine sediment metagenome]